LTAHDQADSGSMFHALPRNELIFPFFPHLGMVRLEVG
jgi:hypothetical protein